MVHEDLIRDICKKAENKKLCEQLLTKLHNNLKKTYSNIKFVEGHFHYISPEFGGVWEVTLYTPSGESFKEVTEGFRWCSPLTTTHYQTCAYEEIEFEEPVCVTKTSDELNIYLEFGKCK